jgi:hypothetical protein
VELCWISWQSGRQTLAHRPVRMPSDCGVGGASSRAWTYPTEGTAGIKPTYLTFRDVRARHEKRGSYRARTRLYPRVRRC